MAIGKVIKTEMTSIYQRRACEINRPEIHEEKAI